MSRAVLPATSFSSNPPRLRVGMNLRPSQVWWRGAYIREPARKSSDYSARANDRRLYLSTSHTCRDVKPTLSLAAVFPPPTAGALGLSGPHRAGTGRATDR